MLISLLLKRDILFAVKRSITKTKDCLDCGNSVWFPDINTVVLGSRDQGNRQSKSGKLPITPAARGEISFMLISLEKSGDGNKEMKGPNRRTEEHIKG